MTEPKVSIIVVGHDEYKKYLPTALKSLECQTASNTEVLYVDNTGNNLSVGCNAGIGRARGKYIVRVDADDWVEPELIENEMDYLDANPDIDCVYSDFLHAKEIAQNVYTLDIVEQKTLTHACAAMFKKSCWEMLGGYDESLEFQESYDFWIRFHLAGFTSARINMPLYYYRQHSGSMSANPKRDAVRKKIMEKYGLHHC